MLEQSFDDLEAVVCDNSDAGFEATTHSVVQGFGDDRVRYVRSSGSLSMPDNWEHGVGHGRGTYVGVLTDRSVFKPRALATVHSAIQETGAEVVNWFNDLYGRDPDGTHYKRRPCTQRHYRLTSREVLEYFLQGQPKWSPKIVPKLMTSVFRRSLLETIRMSPAGRCCPPVAPDFTSGFLALAHCDWVVTIDDALYVSVGTGNGSDFRRRGELADRFRADLGMTWQEMVDRMPTDACFAHALVLNDLMRIRDLVPDRLGWIDIDRPQYYLGCLNDYAKTSRQGVKRDEDLEALLAGLDSEPAQVQDEVRSRRIYANIVLPELSKKKEARVKEPKTSADGAVHFGSVWEAIAWDQANPREPIPEGFLDLRPGLEAMKKVSSKYQDQLMGHRGSPAGSTARRPALRERVLALLSRS